MAEINSVSNECVIFNLPGYRPDFRINVFGTQEFHVHSFFMKMNSTFFRMFLDSPEKQGYVSPTPFPYEWITEVDEGGVGWHLVWDQAPKTTPAPNYVLSINEAQKAFHMFLKAIYQRPFEVSSKNELAELVKNGRYYLALPAVSRSLTLILYNSLRYIESAQFQLDVTEVYVLAAELRNVTLFRECLVWICASWHAPEYKKLEASEPALYKVAHRAFKDIGYKIAMAQHALLSLEISDFDMNSSTGEAQRRSREIETKTEKLFLPLYFRIMLNRGGTFFPSIRDLIAVLRSNLLLNRQNLEAGSGRHCYQFLCAAVEDDDLPWDVEQLDF